MVTQPEAGARRADSITRNTAFYFAAQVTGAAFTAGLTIFLARRLGSHGYGIFSLALGVAGLVALPSDFGISNSVARFVAEHRNDHRRVAAVLADGLRLKLIASVAVSALLFALAGPIASAYRIDALVWPIRGAAVTLFGQSVMMMGTVFVAAARSDLQWWTYLGESAIETTASIALVLAGAGATGAAFGQAIGYLAAGALTILLLARLLGPEILPRRVLFGAHARPIATYAGVLLIVDGAYTAFNQVDVLIIGAYLGPSSVGIFQAPMRLTSFLAYPGGALAGGVAPRLARSSRGEPNVWAFLVALRLLLIVQAVITAFVLGWAPLLVKVLGSSYAQSASVLRALAPFVFLNGFGSLVSISANYLGEARRRVPVALVTVLVNVVLDLVLVPRIGVIGGCVGTNVAYAVYAPAHLIICQRELRLDLRPAAATLARTILAGAAMTGVLFLFGASFSHFSWTVVGGLMGIIAFAEVLWLTGEVKASEAFAALARVPGVRRVL
ncbi:MAG: oligosaccharide flippase family protein [Solirubrobacterales bacterium]|nr:oligosaccharide flippase family protein [Solirubrobacterales bacterium]